MREVRMARFKTMRAATNRFGFHYQNYGDHERGRIQISPEHAKVYARAFKTTPEYILYGQVDSPVDSQVGLISWVAAGELSEIINNFQPGDAEGWIDYPAKHDKIFALRVKGGSMNRVSPEGSIIIIDANQIEMTSNRLYVVGIGDEATYKRYRANPPRLEPDSTDPGHETIFLDGQDYQPLGRVLRTMMDFE